MAFARVLGCLGLLVCTVSARGEPLEPLELHRERGSPFDLEVSGLVADAAPGESRYVKWGDLRKLPGVKQTALKGTFMPPDTQVTALPLSELWKHLPVREGADTLFALCNDGYTSVYRDEFIARHRPYVILEINGRGPEQWKTTRTPSGTVFTPGPYVFMVSESESPGVGGVLDVNHKRPWGVKGIEIANFAERQRDAYSGKWGRLSAAAQAGREIWINSCASCHAGPGTMFGGTKSGRPFQVVEAYAGYNRSYFKKYVRDPRSLVPGAQMEAHSHYTDQQLNELIAFITAGIK